MMKATKEQIRHMERENRKWPAALKRIFPLPPDMLLRMPPTLIEVWRSRTFLVQIHAVRPGIVRMSVNRAAHDGREWMDGISWDDLQRLKRECGRGEKDASEVYPRDQDVVNVASMRHLFIFEDTLLDYAWRKSSPPPRR